MTGWEGRGWARGGGPRWTAWMAGGAGVVLGCGWHNLGAALRDAGGGSLRDRPTERKGPAMLTILGLRGRSAARLGSLLALGALIALAAGILTPPPQTRNSRFPRGWN